MRCARSVLTALPAAALDDSGGTSCAVSVWLVMLVHRLLASRSRTGCAFAASALAAATATAVRTKSPCQFIRMPLLSFWLDGHRPRSNKILGQPARKRGRFRRALHFAFQC